MDTIRRLARALSPLALCLAACSALEARDPASANARAPEPADADALGFSADGLRRLDGFLAGLVERGEVAGASALVLRRGRVAYESCHGLADVERAVPFAPDTLVRVFSMTKAVTSAAAMVLVEDGRLLLDEPASRYLPELGGMQVASFPEGQEPTRANLTLVAPSRPISVRDLLRHTSGLIYGEFYGGPVAEIYREADLWHSSRGLQDFARRVSGLPLLHQPGERWTYGISTDVLAALIERVSGQPFEEFLRERVLGPLGMRATTFDVPPEAEPRLAKVYDRDPSGRLAPAAETLGETWDRESGRTWGGMGLCCTIGDYARFCEMIRRGGELDGARVLSRKSVELMSADHVAGIPGVDGLLGYRAGFGLGFGRLEGAAGGALGSAGQLSWAGAANTRFFIDPSEELVAVFFTQTYDWGLQLDVRFSNAVYQAIAD